MGFLFGVKVAKCRSTPVPVDDWEVKDAARTIIRSQEILQDKRMMKKVGKELKMQAQASQRASAMVSGHKSDYMHPTVSAPMSRSRGR